MNMHTTIEHQEAEEWPGYDARDGRLLALYLCWDTLRRQLELMPLPDNVMNEATGVKFELLERIGCIDHFGPLGRAAKLAMLESGELPDHQIEPFRRAVVDRPSPEIENALAAILGPRGPITSPDDDPAPPPTSANIGCGHSTRDTSS